MNRILSGPDVDRAGPAMITYRCTMEEFSHGLATLLSNSGTLTKTYFASHAGWLGPVVLTTFTLVNSLRILAYFPQIYRAARDTGGASAISIITWGLFLLSHLTTIAYAVVCVGDLLMAIIFLGNAVACLAIVSITLLKRRRHAAAAAGARSQIRARSEAALRNH